MIQRPQSGEYNPYFQGYIDMVPDGEFMQLMERNTAETVQHFENIPLEKHSYRYAEDKWTVLQILMHIIDVERVMAYRALVAARGDNQTPLYSMDDHLYMANSNVETRTMPDLIDEFKAVRAATIQLFRYVTNDQSTFRANAVKSEITPRALGYIIMGHSWHHMRVIENNYGINNK